MISLSSGPAREGENDDSEESGSNDRAPEQPGLSQRESKAVHAAHRTLAVPPRARSPGARSPASARSPAGTRSRISGTGQLSPRRYLEVGLEDSRENLGYHRGIGSPLRQRHHSVRCVDVLVYYGIVMSTFLLYSVGFIAYKLDEDPGEVKEFYRTMTTSESNTIFKIETTQYLEGDDRAVTATERMNDVAGDDTRYQELSASTEAVADAKEVEQWQRYIVVPRLIPKAESTSTSPPSQAPSGNSTTHIHEGQDELDDTFVHLLRAVDTNEKNRSSTSQHGATPVRGANATTVPFLTFPGLSQW
ncbi:hypothetical protein MTO96_002111 [Rhipicephalus appendiculatus]